MIMKDYRITMITKEKNIKKSSNQENHKNQGSDNMKKGWEIKKLGELVEVLDNLRKPITKRDRVEGEYPYYGATGILSYVHNYIFSEKLVLIGEDGAKWLSGDNTSFIAEEKYWVNNHAHVIRPIRKIILDEWIVYFLNFSDLTPFITGMTVPKLNQEKMRSIQIPLPPLPEQQRIVSILNEAFAAIAKAKANAEQNLNNAKELFESYVQAVFENGNWETKTIEEVCDEIFAGGDAPKNNYSIEPNEKYQIPIYANAVKDRGLYGYSDFARVTKPSITISARGSGTGHTEIRFENYLPIVRLIVLIPNLSLINLEFLKYSIDNLEILRSGSAIPQLTVPMIKEYNLPLPLLKEQQTIVQKLDALSAETKKLEAIYQQKINDLEELKKSVLQKAFSGELTSTGSVTNKQAVTV